MAEDDGYNTQDEEIIWYDEAPEYRTIGNLIFDLQINGFRALLPYNKYKDTEDFLEEISQIRKRYRSKHYGSNNEVDCSMSETIFDMLKILNDLSKPDLSDEDINKLSRSYYVEMQVLIRLHNILHGSISEYYESTYFSHIYYLVEPIVI